MWLALEMLWLFPPDVPSPVVRWARINPANGTRAFEVYADGKARCVSACPAPGTLGVLRTEG